MTDWNSGEQLEKVFNFIKEKSNPKSGYNWTQNVLCKYVEIRVDMRDGGFLLKDQNGNIIEIEDLLIEEDEV